MHYIDIERYDMEKAFTIEGYVTLIKDDDLDEEYVECCRDNLIHHIQKHHSKAHPNNHV